MSLISYWYGYKAYLAHNKGDLQTADSLYKKAFDSGCASVKFMGTYGVLLMRLGRFDEAISYYDRALKANDVKENIRDLIRMNRALAYMRTQQLNKAIVALEDLHKKMRSTRVYQALGYAYIMAGQLDKALEYNKEALDYDDSDFVILDNMGQTYYEMSDMENARLYFEKAYEEKSDQIDILYHMGLIREQQGDLTEALKFFRQALLYKPDAVNDVTRPQLFACERRMIDAIRAKGEPVPPCEVEIKRDDMPQELKDTAQ
ncbi:MAG: tetratricopeptide repeat protein [Eubacteriales bacterium]|nr:tetratricopeptide repeat protein [Eubacteriales bacterium]